MWSPARFSMLGRRRAFAPSGPPLLADAQAYTDLQRGLFLHYNMATFVGTDFVSSTTPVDTFSPTGLNIAQWLDVADNFGATYAHLTIKHKDGFCLWPTTTTPHGIANTTWYATNGHPDITQIFVDQCRSHGILPCFYFSIADMNWIDTHPGYTNAQMKAFTEGQVTEVLGRYGPIAAIWLDSSEIFFGNQLPWASSAERAAFFHGVPNGTQTGLIIVNNAHTGSLADSDVIEFEETLPPVDSNPKESCYSLTSSWFWQSDSQAMVDSGTMATRVTTCNARNATILINTPPNTAGIIPSQFVGRLNQINAVLGETPRISPNNMTGNTAPSPYVASATSEYPGGYEAYRCFNSSLDTFWSSNTGALPVFIKIDLGSSQAGSQYSLQTRKGGVYGQWLQWTLAGSNDNSSWTTTDTVTQASVLPGEVKFYTMASPGTYRYWRFTITSTNTGNSADCGNIALFP